MQVGTLQRLFDGSAVWGAKIPPIESSSQNAGLEKRDHKALIQLVEREGLEPSSRHYEDKGPARKIRKLIYLASCLRPMHPFVPF
jgi:hypothetical protein